MMTKIDWKCVRSEHIAEACTRLLKNPVKGSRKSAGLVVKCEGGVLPVTDVLRVDHCLAKGLPPDSQLKFASGENSLKFASGENSLKLLRSLGFAAERLSKEEGEANG